MSNENLLEHAKKCPFCKGKNLMWEKLGIVYFVACDNSECFAEGPVASSQSGALEKWNERAEAGD